MHIYINVENLIFLCFFHLFHSLPASATEDKVPGHLSLCFIPNSVFFCREWPLTPGIRPHVSVHGGVGGCVHRLVHRWLCALKVSGVMDVLCPKRRAELDMQNIVSSVAGIINNAVLLSASRKKKGQSSKKNKVSSAKTTQ